MKISIIGTGYVGLVTGACFAEMGNYTICADVNEEKIRKLNNGIVPIYEPGLDSIIARNLNNGSLVFTTEIKDAVCKSDICFIAVGTPMNEDGSADLGSVFETAAMIGRHMSQPMIIVDKSTVPVGTADKVRAVIAAELEQRDVSFDFDVVSNPEFLKEGSAIKDFMHPDRIIVGADNPKSLEVLHELYSSFMKTNDRFIGMDTRSAEMTKYAANSMLATKISFINEMANICELVGADINKVRVGIGSDTRIGYHFIYPGCGFGGSCFPKDINALSKTARELGYDSLVLKAVNEVNIAQKMIIPRKVIQRFGENLEGMTFAVWGLAFKPETDDMREASAITAINELAARGAVIRAYDPKAVDEAKNIYLKDNSRVFYSENKYDAVKGADALILMTEWKEFRSPDFDLLKELLKIPMIFDGRNQYNKEALHKKGFEYWQIGVSPK